MSQPPTSGDPRVQAALQDYLERCDRGETVNREEFLARHGEIAAELQSFLSADDEILRVAGRGSQTAGGSTRPPEASTHSLTGRGQETGIPQRKAATNTGTLPPQFGRYKILRALGSGAMGTVYLAEDTQLHRRVALKTSSFDNDATGELLERFYREARSAANLRHNNICPVFDVDQIDGRHFISMAYIDGQPLSAQIQPNKPFSEKQALLLVRKLALALQEAHDHGIIHRDLKPGNIMMDSKGEPIITDFGLAKQMGKSDQARITQSGMIIGSPAYMSPEQVDGEPDKLTASTDQYSLGVILYELLTGQLPFRGTISSIIASILTKQPPKPSALRPGLDPRVEALCLKMMARSPSNRFPSLKAAAAEMATIYKAVGSDASASVAPKPASPAGPTGTQKLPAASATGKRPKPKADDDLSESAVTSLGATARKLLARKDYEQAIQMLDSIPEARRTDEIRALLDKARSLSDEVMFLLTEIDDAVRRNDADTAVRKADDLLKIKPGHHRAKEIQEEYGGYGAGGAVRGMRRGGRRGGIVGEEGFNLWIALAVGLVVLGAALWGVTAYLKVGDAVVKVTISDPDVTVSIKGHTLNITGAREPVKVTPGDGTLKVSYGDLEFTSDTFTLKKGENPAVTIERLNDKLAAKFGDQPIGSWTVPAKSKNASLATGSSGPGASGWTDLLANVSPADVNSRGTWNRTSDGHLNCNAKGNWPFPELSFSAHPVGSYELECSVIFHKTDHLVLFLPAGVGMTNLILIRSSGGAAIWQKGGPFAPDKQPAEQKLVFRFQPETEYAVRITVDVKPDGSQVVLSGTVDGQSLPTLAANPAQLTSLGPPEGMKLKPLPALEKEFGVHAGWGSTASLTRFRFRTTGAAAPARPAPSLTSAPFDAAQAKAHQDAWANYLGVPAEYTNSLGMKFVLIPPGEYLQGAGAQELSDVLAAANQDPFWLNYGKSEGPQHKVKITKAFFLAVNEVTQKQYEQLIGSNPASFSAGGALKQQVGGQNTANWPVEMVSWTDAVEFCRKLGEKEKVKGAGYRLPTEAEWEYAARAGTATIRWTGDADSTLGPAAWFGTNSQGRTHAVGETKANAFGLTDMLGNVGEWCQDGWEADAYSKRGQSVANDPTGPEVAPRIFRGGSWEDPASRVRSAYRVGSDPSGKSAYVGLRPVLAVDAVKAVAPQPQSPDVAGKSTPRVRAKLVGNAPSRAVAPFDAATAVTQQEAWAKHYGVPVEFANSVGMKFRFIPRGEFTMGSPANETGHDDDEVQVKAAVSPFWLGRTEVTQGQWQQVMGTTAADQAQKANAKLQGAGSEYPMHLVSYDDAAEFCRRLTEKERAAGHLAADEAFVLPTEAQWEYACRAGAAGRYSGADDDAALANIAWFRANSAQPVEQKKPNAWGLCDLHGNLWEWCRDSYAVKLPGGDDPEVTVSDGTRILRGGSWYDTSKVLRSAERNHIPADSREFNVGFRVALTIDVAP